jgi:peptidoglycan-associated lipoprotein
LEGNTDERGSPEYNIALGEQRAKSVAGMMKVQGVSENQLNIVSYGEEKPAAFGSDESAWEKNRRVEIVYQPK